jgi:hypothetical protein
VALAGRPSVRHTRAVRPQRQATTLDREVCRTLLKEFQKHYEGDVETGAETELPSGLHWLVCDEEERRIALQGCEGNVAKLGKQQVAVANTLGRVRILHTADEDCIGYHFSMQPHLFPADFGFSLRSRTGARSAT